MNPFKIAQGTAPRLELTHQSAASGFAPASFSTAPAVLTQLQQLPRDGGTQLGKRNRPSVSSSAGPSGPVLREEDLIWFPSSAGAFVPLAPFHRGGPLTELDDKQRGILAHVWECLDQGHAWLQEGQKLQDGTIATEFGVSSMGYARAMMLKESAEAINDNRAGIGAQSERQHGGTHQYQVIVYARGQHVLSMVIAPKFGADFIVEYVSVADANCSINSSVPLGRTGSASAGLQSADRGPADAEHVNLLNGLSAVTPDEMTHHHALKVLLCHLETIGIKWSELGAGNDQRGLRMLSKIITEWNEVDITRLDMRAAIEHFFKLKLPTARRRHMPVRAEHKSAMAKLAGRADLPANYRTLVNQFFCYLEANPQLGAPLIVQADGTVKTTARLETIVNEGIESGKLPPNMRAALNTAFPSALKPIRVIPSESTTVQRKRLRTTRRFEKAQRVDQMARLYRVPEQREHRDVMLELATRKDMSKQYKSFINKFLCYLEDSHISWKRFAPLRSVGAPGDTVAAADTAILANQLETLINTAIADRKVHRATRPAVSRLVGVPLKSRS